MKQFACTRKIPLALMIPLFLLLLLSSWTSPPIHAASFTRQNSHVSRLAQDCNPSNAIVIIWYNNFANAWSDCSPWTYETPGLGHVNEVETSGDTSDFVWFKWYNGPTGKYCTLSGNFAHWFSPPGITNITQVEYGPSHPDSQCS